MSKILVRNVTKVFGDSPQALALLRAGRGKAEVLATTGASVGLNDVSLDIAAGQVFVIMGLSGSGKSTLVRHLNRLIDPTAGEILVDGENILKLDAAGLRQFRRRQVSRSDLFVRGDERAPTSSDQNAEGRESQGLHHYSPSKQHMATRAIRPGLLIRWSS